MLLVEGMFYGLVAISADMPFHRLRGLPRHKQKVHRSAPAIIAQQPEAGTAFPVFFLPF